MNNRVLIILVTFLIPLFGLCLTEKSQVSILTIEPGTEYYSIFGHTAIRIIDEPLNMDKVYNFGSFDFETPFFYLKFLKGDLDYYLSIESFDSLLYYSKLEQREITEQILKLDYSEKTELYYNLERQYNSNKRSYKYDFFYDNCATRVRDAILKVKREPFKHDSLLYCCQTFRQLLLPYISKNYWIDFGINISLGKEADKIIITENYMFLPSYIMDFFQDTDLVLEKKIFHDHATTKNKTLIFAKLLPWIIASFLIIFSIVLTYIGYPEPRRIIFYLYITLICSIGILLCLIELYSDNPAFTRNLNIYWTLPSLIILLVQNRLLNNILKIIYITLLIIMLITWNQFSQGFSTTFLPWILTLIIILILDFTWNKKTFAIK